MVWCGERAKENDWYPLLVWCRGRAKVTLTTWLPLVKKRAKENDWYLVVPSSTLVTLGEERRRTIGTQLYPLLVWCRENKGNLDYLVTLGEERERESKGNLDYLVTFGEEESKGERLVPSCTLSYFCNLG
ncbi:Hypothetical protein BRZCDTV_213 [Brazilian cedratvirus IHUMI]|uniref:Uncharacterized protein n=1 Tax=Brazilian cedratvirus IHUMI TaxID=2126980 RepID=A0A2R8FDY8_9VIRU|nr:Hypothetical protein BRZCDTV_213 [Brazilian cedratvirus IHUMI]